MGQGRVILGEMEGRARERSRAAEEQGRVILL
jgi:hypothetical protein